MACTTEAQDSIDSWGSHIHTTRGNLKSDKFHMSVHTQILDGKGGYEYLSIAQPTVGVADSLEDDL